MTYSVAASGSLAWKPWVGQILKRFLLNDVCSDIGSLATVAVIAIAAIFVLPQAIYWITGINLSTFTLGRSKPAPTLSDR